MTDNELRHMTVAVAVIYDPRHGFLLWNNKRWGGYAFPMKHMEPNDAPAQTALRVLDDRDFPLDLPNATAGALEQTGLFGISDGSKEDTYYDYHVLEIDPGQPLNPTELDPDLRFFTYNQLQAATNVTWSTRALATSLVETQDVVVSVISRERGGNIEFLLVYNHNHGYFFPSIRRKTHGPLEQMATQAIRFDTAYNGAVNAKYCGEVPLLRTGTRYGVSERRYRLFLCYVNFPGFDLFTPGNALEQSLDAFQSAKTAAGQAFGARSYGKWFAIDEIKSGSDISADMEGVLSNVIECASSATFGDTLL